MKAAFNGHTQVTETLFGHGANVNAKDEVFCQLCIQFVIVL